MGNIGVRSEREWLTRQSGQGLASVRFHPDSLLEAGGVGAGVLATAQRSCTCVYQARQGEDGARLCSSAEDKVQVPSPGRRSESTGEL